MSRLTADEMRRLADSREYQKLLSADPELERLEGRKYDKPLESLMLSEALGFPIAIGCVQVHPVTPAIWSLLWMIDSPYVSGGRASELDADIFLYLLRHGTLRLWSRLDALSSLPAAAAGFCAAHCLSFEEAHGELSVMIRSALHALSMLPSSKDTEQSEDPHYDTDWLTRIAGIAARESGERAKYCMHVMGMSTVCAYYVNCCRRERLDGDRIGHRADGELAKLIMERVYQIGRNYLDGRTEK